MDPTIYKEDDRAMAKDQFYLISYLDVQGILNQYYAMGFTIRFADPLMVALN
jgi:hypothetical protein